MRFLIKQFDFLLSFSFPEAFKLKTLSIKNLTLLGFTLVALPLVLALLYSAVQVNQLSQQGANAIFNVASLIKSNREVSETMTKMERYASQYLVLNDEELLQSYLQQKTLLNQSISHNLGNSADNKLQRLSQKFLQLSNNIDQFIQPNSAPYSLKKLQFKFKQLVKISQKINFRTNEVISSQAEKLKNKADNVSSMMMQSLVIIPVIIIIAGLFVLLITKPLKALIEQIQRLERGDFEQKIMIQGSVEVVEIADALEVMRTRLHALELQKSSFIRHISHELKTPLAAIKVGIELLNDSSVGKLTKQQQEVSNIIASNVERLQLLIEDLLDFNIVLDSTSLQDSEKLALVPLLRNVINARILDIKHKKLIVKQNIAASYLYSNAKQLQVVLDNLLSNAIKFSPYQGEICIDAVVNGSELVLSISDQGIGIADEQQEKIFTAFYQGTPAQSSQIKGSGLGLTIVKELLMRLNGDVILESRTSLVTGSKFTLLLPRAYQQSRAYKQPDLKKTKGVA
ncbi:MAG: HAMP domain-containing histidine kinase [Alteromonadaceae bacterium]|nr:HAMP domain-containing histidine kinase [Alteromonadaceae bacterium]